MAPGFKTGGRKKGSKNKHKLPVDLGSDVVFQAAQNGETPLEYMLRVMRDQTQEYPRRDEMAKAAAPYVHARLNATDLKTTITHEDVPADELRAQILAEMAELGITPALPAMPEGVANKVNGANGKTKH